MKRLVGLLSTALAVAVCPLTVRAQPVGNPFQVNSYTAGAQDAPSVALDANAAFVAVWESAGQDGDDLGIFGQRY
jgi:hypothetical protein